METENRRRAPDAIDVYQGRSPMEALHEAEELRRISDSEPMEKLLVDILSEKEQQNIGNAINGRNPLEY